MPNHHAAGPDMHLYFEGIRGLIANSMLPCFLIPPFEEHRFYSARLSTCIHFNTCTVNKSYFTVTIRYI